MTTTIKPERLRACRSPQWDVDRYRNTAAIAAGTPSFPTSVFRSILDANMRNLAIGVAGGVGTGGRNVRTYNRTDWYILPGPIGFLLDPILTPVAEWVAQQTGQAGPLQVVARACHSNAGYNLLPHHDITGRKAAGATPDEYPLATGTLPLRQDIADRACFISEGCPVSLDEGDLLVQPAGRLHSVQRCESSRWVMLIGFYRPALDTARLEV